MERQWLLSYPLLNEKIKGEICLGPDGTSKIDRPLGKMPFFFNVALFFRHCNMYSLAF
jgi:hypothetical protein